LEDEEIKARVNSINWYHSIEVAPGVVTPGLYDPTPLLDLIGFPKDLSGKTILDIGANDGFFTFEAEKRGAKRVLAVDLHPAGQRGFALAHELRGSKAEYVMGSVYDLAPEIHGTFDVVFFFGVLYHLRNPLLALDKIHAVCREYALVETHVLDQYFVHQGKITPLDTIHSWLKDSPIMQFYPNNELNNDLSNWWAPNIQCLRAMLDTSGFQAELMGQWGGRAAFKATRVDFTPPHWY